jgi:hypothetical protein|nr:MAG TPA: Methyltransferase domain [Caudoviricetes sp.]
MILDMTCGARLMWHQKHHPDAVYCDIRQGTETLSDGREVHINPDQVADFRRLPFPDETFTLVNFDPPHLTKAGNTGWLAKKYGVLFTTWEEDLKAGFEEAFRVLKPEGVLTLKWCSEHIPLGRVLELAPHPPLYGTRQGRKGATTFTVFQKPGTPNDKQPK